MPEYLTPGVYYELLDTAPPLVRGVRTDIAAFVGLAPRGPLHMPVRIESWRSYQAIFGSFVSYGYLAYAVKGFLENGGTTCFVVRVAGSGAAAASVVLKNAAGHDLLRIEAKNPGIWGHELVLSLTLRQARYSIAVTGPDGEREVHRDLSLDDEDPRFIERMLETGDDRVPPSRWISATVLAAQTDFASPPDLAQSGIATFAKFALSGGADGLAALTRDDFLGTLDDAETGKRGLGSLEAVSEVAIVAMPDMHIIPTPPPAVPDIPPPPPVDPCCGDARVRGCEGTRVRGVGAQAPASPRTPEPAYPHLHGTGCEGTRVRGVGAQAPASPRTPAPPDPQAAELPPRFSAVDVYAMQRALIEHCELRGDRVAILDAPVHDSGSAYDVSEILDWRSKLESDRGFAALYYPWLKVLDPLKLGGSPVRAVPPSGHIAGLYARTDLDPGVHKAPANGEARWSEDVTFMVEADAQGVLNPEGVNCLRAFPGRGIIVYGARTISSDPGWCFINIRRLLLMIEKAVDLSTQWAVFEPHDEVLRQKVVQSISGFLESLWKRGMLAGATKDEAFFVKCDETNNPPQSVDDGRIVADVGVSAAAPAEFIVFRIGRTVGELETVER